MSDTNMRKVEGGRWSGVCDGFSCNLAGLGYQKPRKLTKDLERN